MQVAESPKASVSNGKSVARTSDLSAMVRRIVRETPVWDLHTHLYPASFGTPLPGKAGSADPNGLLLWGVDELLTYHYLIAEVFRVVPASQLPYEQFWAMSKQEQADHVWKHLFLERSPVSEACRGVLTTLHKLGLDTSDRNLNGYRAWFAEQDPNEHIDRVMEVAGVNRITMTNAVFDDNERNRWLENPQVGADSRFAGVLRFDPLILEWEESAAKLTEWGYPASAELDAKSVESAKRFLSDWIDRVEAIYCAVSLPPSFRYQSPDDGSVSSQVLAKVILPLLEERDLAFAMMIGSERQVNPRLKDAGDMVGTSDVPSVVRLVNDFPSNRFLCTMLARENQHELAVATRKFGNLMLFGCWWFVNNPSLIDEITRMRVELLGLSFAPQHSDARVLEQIVYKWGHSRELIAEVLIDKYQDIAEAGWIASEQEIQRDVSLLLEGNFANFLKS